jgi:predicted Rossmann fold nucleotide-binding protein DprA/Smf involved in DNA uptake
VKLGERTFVLLLSLTPGVGGKTITRVLARNQLLNRTREEFLTLSPETLREEYRFSTRAAANFTENRQALLKAAQENEERYAAFDMRWVTTADSDYPRLIEEMDPDPPGLLFLYGNQKLLNLKSFCVLNSRNAMPADLDLMEKLCEEAVLNSEVLVTGHDSPTYQRTAIVPLRWGSPRILCVDRGFFSVLGEDLRQEAFNAARLWRYEFDPATDLVVSASRPTFKYIGVNNQIRDRLIGCLSQRLDFVNVSESGNMDKIIKLALKAGRPVRVSDRTMGYRRYQALGAEVIKT